MNELQRKEFLCASLKVFFVIFCACKLLVRLEILVVQDSVDGLFDSCRVQKRFFIFIIRVIPAVPSYSSVYTIILYNTVYPISFRVSPRYAMSTSTVAQVKLVCKC